MKKRWRKIEYDLINKQQAIKEAVNNWKLSKRMLSVLGLAVTVFCITMIALLVFFRHRMKAPGIGLFGQYRIFNVSKYGSVNEKY